MRAPPFPPAEMPSGLRALNDEMTGYIAEHLKGFVSKREDGALVGPFAPMLRFPTFGRAAWTYTKALIDNSKLPKPAHEAAILVTGAAFNSRYELYAHERVGYNLWGKLLTGAWILEGAFSAIILGWAATRFRARGVTIGWPIVVLVVMFLNLSPWLSPMKIAARLSEPEAHLLHGTLVTVGFLIPGLLLIWLIDRAERRAVPAAP